ncbi:COG4223 family protein [Hoeflea poritis]|uniref:Mitofilin family membrane protein n=1 Tax=Hoeflea poritis TaxID=2993659 RepID=A0ABT4VL88_9HYPH|nr:mitofilin family membrane protein [Hoeflea poritis]MDA4845492.1 mitofilin family membrane protein [Hoeflea poritis]
MAQGSKPRHSRTTRKPVTIDLEPEAVKKEETATSDDKKKTTASAKSTAAKKSGTVPKTGTKGAKAVAEKTGDEPAPEFGRAEKVTAQAERAAKAMSGATASGGTDAKTEPAAAPAKRKTEKGPDEKPAAATKATDTGAAVAKDKAAASTGGGFRTGAAGLAGGVVAIALYAGLQWGGILPAPGGSAASGGGLSGQIDELKSSIAALEKQVADGTGSLGQDLESRLSALETGSGGGDGSAVKALETQVSSVAAKVESLGSGGQDGSLSDVTQKLSAIETAQSQQQAGLQSLQQSVTGLISKISSDEAKQNEAMQALDTRLSSIETSLSAPREDIKVARALAAANLKAAIDRGGSFMAELEAFASVDGDSPAIDQLRNFAASGVPSRAELQSGFPTVANTIINAASGSGSDSGWVDRLMNSASSIVSVRPVGDVAGDSVEAIVARMETKLNNGDLQGAVDEWKTLPETSRTASSAYEKDLAARILVEKIVSGTVNAALPTETAQPDNNAAGTTQTGGQSE